MAVRLLICDDSPEARLAARTMLADEGRIEIVGEAENGEDGVSLALATRPDVVLMDVAMPGTGGVEATRRLHQLLPATRIVAFAGSDDSEVITAMLEAGASAYCIKGAPLWELERAITMETDPLVRLAHGLAKTVNDAGAAEFVARELVAITGAAFAATYLAAPDVGLSLGGLAGDFLPSAMRSAPAVASRAFAGASLAWADPTELAELWQLGCTATQAVAAPLVVDGEALGAVLVAMPATSNGTIDGELLTAAADLAALSLANVRRLALTYAEARRDALTGLPNKRAFTEDLHRLARGAPPSGEELALVILDVDDFKLVNDSEGHLAGDSVLVELARVMQRSVRSGEQAYRIGGEEFSIVVEGSVDDAARVAERVRSAVAGQRRGRRLPTISAGAAAVRAPVRIDELLARADQALYKAKRAGKNRVFVEGGGVPAPPNAQERETLLRVLIVEDDEGMRTLLRTTFEIADIEVDEAFDARSAEARISRVRPDIVVLDVGLPGVSGLELCRRLRADSETAKIAVVLLTGQEMTLETARAAGADAFVRKPFSPLELLTVAEQLAQGMAFEHETEPSRRSDEQLLLYAQDLRRLREIERGQRLLLQRAYRETVTALATALESKDTGTREHSQRVLTYALELARAIDPALLKDPSVEYGFLLHDVGKIGIPDQVLRKPAPLSEEERRLMQTHTVLGEQMLGEVALLQGDGLRIVRGHHERWDGRGYPDGLRASDIPLSARVFAVADALDAITSSRPYRAPRPWDEAVAEIVRCSGKQFDPDIVDEFLAQEPRLRRINYELVAATQVSQAPVA
jgi:diguanylate cyclase (GGDEF)-like protein